MYTVWLVTRRGEESFYIADAYPDIFEIVRAVPTLGVVAIYPMLFRGASWLRALERQRKD